MPMTERFGNDENALFEHIFSNVERYMLENILSSHWTSRIYALTDRTQLRNLPAILFNKKIEHLNRNKYCALNGAMVSKRSQNGKITAHDRIYNLIIGCNWSLQRSSNTDTNSYAYRTFLIRWYRFSITHTHSLSHHRWSPLLLFTWIIIAFGPMRCVFESTYLYFYLASLLLGCYHY